MTRIDWRHAVSAIVILAIGSAALLWAWNTLAELFGAPAADFRHALAFLVAAATVRVLASGRRNGYHRWTV